MSGGTPAADGKRTIVAAVVAAIVGFAVFLPQVGYEFVYDDVSIVALNPVVAGGSWWDAVSTPWWPPERSIDPLYRPVTTLSLRLTYALFGAEHATAYRITNAILHAVCASLVVLFTARLWSSAVVGAMGGLLFAVHPVHTEAVALVVGRAELLAALFALLLLYRHINHVRSGTPISVRYHCATAVLFLLALGCKEHSLLLLPAIAVVDAWRDDGTGKVPFRTRLRRLASSHYLGLVVAAAAFLFVRWLIFGQRAFLPAEWINPFANPLVDAPLVTRLATPMALLFLSVRLMLIPVGLCPIWSVGGFNLPGTFLRLDVGVGAVLLLGLIALSVIGWSYRSRAGLLGGLLLLFLLLPCHAFPAANWLFAERWLYLPSAFVLVGVARLARRGSGAVGLILVAGAFAMQTLSYQPAWRTTETLMAETIDRQPDNYQGLVGYCGQRLKTGELPQAADEVARLIAVHPAAPQAWYYQALLMDELGRPHEVLEAFRRYLVLTKVLGVPARLVQARDRAEADLDRAQKSGRPD